MVRTFSVVFLLVAGGLGGCSAGQPAAGPVPAPPVVAVASPSATEIDDPPGTNTCGRLVAAVRDATLMEPGAVGAIVTASSSADAPLAEAAQRLGTAYAAAVAARGSATEPDAVAAVSAAGADMSKVCDDSGLASVG